MRRLKIEITPKDYIECFERMYKLDPKAADEFYSTFQRYMTPEDMSTLNQYLGAFREFDDEAVIIEEIEE